VWPAQYRRERKEVATLLARRSDHPGVRVALDWIARVMRTASVAAEKTPGQTHWARLHQSDVQPLRVLQECAAVWTFAQRNPYTLVDDHRLTWALGIAVAYLVPREFIKGYLYGKGEHRRYRTVTAKAREEIGREIRDMLHPLLRGVSEAAEQDAARAQRAKEALRVPFNQQGAQAT
jgi:hypothetical protein